MTALGDFVTIVGPAGVIGGIVSGSVNHLLKTWGERRTIQAQACYLALRVAITLERFAGDCLDLIAEIDTGAELRLDPSSLPTNLPPIAEYPADDLGWRAMQPALANAALGMHVERASAQGQVRAEWTYGGPTAAPFECARLAARLGVRAWRVAIDMRAAYDLPPFSPEHPFIDTLRRRVEEDERRRQASIARTRAMFDPPQS